MENPQTNVIPEPGDIWELRMPGQGPRVREVKALIPYFGGTKGQIMVYVQWCPGTRGYHYKTPVYRLLRFGRRLSTLAQRRGEITPPPGPTERT